MQDSTKNQEVTILGTLTTQESYSTASAVNQFTKRNPKCRPTADHSAETLLKSSD